MWRYAFWGSLGLLVLMAAGGVFWATPLYFQGARVATGVRVAGARLGSPEELEARLVALARELEAEVVELQLTDGEVSEGARAVKATWAELGVSVDVEATSRRARAFGRRGSPLARERELARLREEGIDVPVALRMDPERLFERLEATKRELDRAPLPARYDSRTGTLVPHVSGRYLDLERAADRVWSSANARAASLTSPSGGSPPARIELGLARIAPRLNSDVLGPFEAREVAAEFSTRFRSTGDQATRAMNIAVAAERLDGVILLPGDRMSFNDVIGERSVGNGFQESWQLMEGEFTRGVGGGTCQVSSTLHAAALQAGLDIVEAYPHSRPLAYIGKGLDATVAWPFVDLKLRNPWPEPLVISASAKAGTLTIRFLTRQRPAKVRVQSEIKETFPFPRVVEVGHGVPRGTYKLKQEGIPGYRIERTRSIWPNAGEVRRDVRITRYRPTPELYLIAPDFDPEELPPLPEGAEGYEPEGEDIEETEGGAFGPLG
jgi:vancomycin resistance protein YoaR